MAKTINGVHIEEFEKFSLEIHYTYFPGDPGQLSGPPEKCYPPEDPDLEFTAIWLQPKTADIRMDILALNLLEDLDVDISWIEDNIFAKHSEDGPDYPEED